MPAFRDLLKGVRDFLDTREGEIRKQNDSLLNALCNVNSDTAATSINSLPLDSARALLEKNFDSSDGGFGRAPKFPHPGNIERLLRHWAIARSATGGPDARALHMAVFSLEKMAHGGMFDQLGGGFCRYSVDNHWMIPHFEKMLYDNGQLLALYAEAWAATGNPLFERICRQTAGWVIREMQAPDGGYYSSLDADSEGEEGRFYVWTPEQVMTLLGDEDYPLFARRYGLDRDANFEGHWHLHVYRTVDELAVEFSCPAEKVRGSLEHSCRILFHAREQRVRPDRDDKVLTSWNGLMIRGMAIAARHLEEPDWLDSAQRALDFIRHTLWKNGRLLATCKDGHAHLNAYLDDYVYLIDAILEMLQARWRDGDLDFAVELAEVVLAHFQDPAGGFFFTSDDHETLIQRPRTDHDDAMPAGNGIAARVFGRLGHLLGETRYLEATEQTLKSTWASIETMPHGHTSLLVALEETLFPFQTVVIRGPGATLENWRNEIGRGYAPARLALAIPSTAGMLPGQLALREPHEDTVAYLCSGTHCSEPVTHLDELKTRLS